MWFDGVRQPNTLYIANVSHGKDGTAMLRAIQLMRWPLDGIISADVWFDNDTPAELPPMAAFKDEWDKKCFETFGVPVKRVCAVKKETNDKLTYVDIFYKKKPRKGMYGFPQMKGNWCNSELKLSPCLCPRTRGGKILCITSA